MEALFPVAVFVLCLLTIELIYYGFSTVRQSEGVRIKKRLKSIQEDASGRHSVDIQRRRRLSDIPWLDRLLRSVPGIWTLDELVLQANLGIPVGLAVLVSILLFFVGYTITSSFLKISLLPLFVGVVFASLPILYIRVRKQRRMEKFQRQLPEALEMIGRSLRAGHAFSSGLKMICDEFDDPIGTEFQRTLDEINFGVSVPDAMKNLGNRVDCADLRFFVVSVIIQRDTGGNLAEIVDTMGGIIRERFKLNGKIRILTAEGRLSAVLLCMLPFVMVVVIHFLNPNLIRILNDDPLGRILSGIALGLMILGIVISRKMMRIRV
ncbi:MAG: type II secretion system F family protein [Deltaproteobacteria bacterium]|nr:type II secretion system F family protein [Deltaproteobacteria bacterium]